MKKIILAVSAISLISSGLFADSTLGERSTRLDSMELNNYMTADGFNIFFNPANVAKQKTGAFLEIGRAANGVGAIGETTNGGATTQDTQYTFNGFAGAFIDTGVGTVGLVLNRDNNFGNGFGMAASTRKNNIDLFYGIGITETMNLGMRLTYASVEKNNDSSVVINRTLADKDSYNRNDSSYSSSNSEESGSDLTIQVGGQFIGIDATVAYGIYSYDQGQTPANGHREITTYGPGAGLALDSNVSEIFLQDDDTVRSSDGASILELALAYTLPLSDTSSVTPYGVYQSTNYDMNTRHTTFKTTDTFDTSDNKNKSKKVEVKEETGSFKDSTDVLVLGAAYNLKPVENVLVVVAGEYTYSKNTLESYLKTTQDQVIDTVFIPAPTTTNTTHGATGVTTNYTDTTTVNDLSIVIATEAYVTETLALRFGLRESVYHDSDYSDKDKLYNDVYTNDDKKTTGNNTSNDTSNTTNDETDESSNYSSQQPSMQLAVGFGYKATETVSVDGLVNADIFLRGPNFLSGQNHGVINARLAVNYNF